MSCSVEISVILHLPKSIPYSFDKILKRISALHLYKEHRLEIILLDENKNIDQNNKITQLDVNGNPIHIIKDKSSSSGKWLNKALAKANCDALLYINNKNTDIQLKNSALSAFLLCAERHPGWGFIYADYQLISGTKKTDIHLLPFHSPQADGLTDTVPTFPSPSQATF